MVLTLDQYLKKLEKENKRKYTAIYNAWTKTGNKYKTYKVATATAKARYKASKKKAKEEYKTATKLAEKIYLKDQPFKSVPLRIKISKKGEPDKFYDTGLTPNREGRRIKSTRMRPVNYMPLDPTKRGSHFGEWLELMPKDIVRYADRKKWISQNKFVLGKDLSERLFPLVNQMSEQNLKYRQDEFGHDFHRVLRDTKRLIGLWDNNQKLIDDLRLWGSNKVTLKELITNPSKLMDYYRVQKNFAKILKTTVQATNKDIIKSIYSRTSHRDLIDRLEEFLIGTEYWARYWEEMRATSVRLNIPLTDLIIMNRKPKKEKVQRRQDEVGYDTNPTKKKYKKRKK